MYASAFVLGFHGCDESLGEEILAGRKHLTASTNSHDWLGHGIYFWENSPARALEWAKFIQAHPNWFGSRISKPFAIGAIIDLGLCLDLTEASSLAGVRSAYEQMKFVFDALDIPLPENERGGSRDEDLVKRHFDCAVINYLHSLRASYDLRPYDSVRGAFLEGQPLYPGARIMEKIHIQICVRQTAQIRGYFRPPTSPMT